MGKISDELYAEWIVLCNAEQYALQNSVLGSTGNNDKEETMGGYNDEESGFGPISKVNAASVFNDLQTVFGIGEEFQSAADFYRDLHYAAEGIRQHDALHRVTDAFYGKAEWALVDDDPAAKWDDDPTETQYGSRTTTILGGNEEEE